MWTHTLKIHGASLEVLLRPVDQDAGACRLQHENPVFNIPVHRHPPTGPPVSVQVNLLTSPGRRIRLRSPKSPGCGKQMYQPSARCLSPAAESQQRSLLTNTIVLSARHRVKLRRNTYTGDEFRHIDCFVPCLQAGTTLRPHYVIRCRAQVPGRLLYPVTTGNRQRSDT